MDISTCGCPMDLEFIYHSGKCSRALSKPSRIGISGHDCPSCAALRAEVVALKKVAGAAEKYASNSHSRKCRNYAEGYGLLHCYCGYEELRAALDALKKG